MRKTFSKLMSLAGLAFVAMTATASAELGVSKPWQMWLQEPGSPVAERLEDFHILLMVVEGAIVLLVLAIMIFIIFRFNAKRNPVPSKTTHNTMLEIAWTALPIIILAVIAIPSLRELYYSDRTFDADMTLKVTGHQWYWSYAYPDHGDFEFDSFMVPTEDLKEGQPRLLTVDNPVVLPVGAKVRILLASEDVIHNWAVPSLMLKTDTTPGRTNETWTQITQEGDYYGMCSELCGVNHGFMPIHIKAVSKEAFDEWVEKAMEQFAAVDREPLDVARADSAVGRAGAN